jgi:hypothetical protein
MGAIQGNVPPRSIAVQSSRAALLADQRAGEARADDWVKWLDILGQFHPTGARATIRIVRCGD